MRRTMPRLAIATLAALLAPVAAPHARAAAVQSYNYDTNGGITGSTGNQPIYFNGAYGEGTLTTPGAFSLGTFGISTSLPSTATLTYNNTPFEIDLDVSPRDSSRYTNYYPYYYYGTPSYQYKITGVINGSVTGTDSSMFVSINSITGNGWQNGYGSAFTSDAAPPFPVSALTIVSPQGISAADGYYPGSGVLMAQVLVAGSPINPTPAPEPATLAVFAAALAGWAVRRKARNRA